MSGKKKKTLRRLQYVYSSPGCGAGRVSEVRRAEMYDTRAQHGDPCTASNYLFLRALPLLVRLELQSFLCSVCIGLKGVEKIPDHRFRGGNGDTQALLCCVRVSCLRIAVYRVFLPSDISTPSVRPSSSS